MAGKLMAGTPRIFISHATADTAFAERLADNLRRAGADVWLDATHLAGTGGNFVQRISAALNSCDVLLLVLSPDALASQWVPDEMDAAIVRHKQGFMKPPVIVMSANVPLRHIPGLWTTYNRIDASGTNYDKALRYVYRVLGIRMPAQPILPAAKPTGTTASPTQTTTSHKQASASAPYQPYPFEPNREADWEAKGREIRSAIERQLTDLEDALDRVRRER